MLLVPTTVGPSRIQGLGLHAAEPIAAVYASPMQRTVETAGIVARPHHLEIVTRDRLREVDHGRWEGLRRAEVEARHRRLIDSLYERPEVTSQAS